MRKIVYCANLFWKTRGVMRNFETFFYNPSVAVHLENEFFENVVILLYENDEC